jgi:hypothetical protein
MAALRVHRQLSAVVSLPAVATVPVISLAPWLLGRLGVLPEPRSAVTWAWLGAAFTLGSVLYVAVTLSMIAVRPERATRVRRNSDFLGPSIFAVSITSCALLLARLDAAFAVVSPAGFALAVGMFALALGYAWVSLHYVVFRVVSWAWHLARPAV